MKERKKEEGNRGQGHEFLSTKDHVSVDLVSNDRDLMLLSNCGQKMNTHSISKHNSERDPADWKETKLLTLQDITEVLLRVVRAAGVGGVVHQNRPGLLVNQALELHNVNLPRFLWLREKRTTTRKGSREKRRNQGAR